MCVWLPSVCSVTRPGLCAHRDLFEENDASECEARDEGNAGQQGQLMDEPDHDALPKEWNPANAITGIGGTLVG
jgi:hypothetical protein